MSWIMSLCQHSKPPPQPSPPFNCHIVKHSIPKVCNQVWYTPACCLLCLGCLQVSGKLNYCQLIIINLESSSIKIGQVRMHSNTSNVTNPILSVLFHFQYQKTQNKIHFITCFQIQFLSPQEFFPLNLPKNASCVFGLNYQAHVPIYFIFKNKVFSDRISIYFYLNLFLAITCPSSMYSLSVLSNSLNSPTNLFCTSLSTLTMNCWSWGFLPFQSLIITRAELSGTQWEWWVTRLLPNIARLPGPSVCQQFSKSRKIGFWRIQIFELYNKRKL